MFTNCLILLWDFRWRSTGPGDVKTELEKKGSSVNKEQPRS